ncbi:MAG: hypothetical protein FD144_2152 [Rhodospirillaceae bacterium]|nr:MAG: hypothetical protein FD144_2152 [Rhodospirillaceae bacterium]
MPICEIDPWRAQYFETVDCPADVFIPTEDSDAWMWNPDHRWVYDKLAVVARQGLEAAPHGVPPRAYPVFSKPIYNLKGMGVGSRALRSPADYEAAYRPGHMWMPLLQGDHVSSDAALVDGAPHWWRHARGIPAEDGTFDYWEVDARSAPEIETWACDWCRRHLAGYTGMVNLETIGGRIIEVHLRFADQWPDLYGKGWVDALVRLYARREWRYDDVDRRTGYSVVLFMPHGRPYRHPPQALLQRIEHIHGVSSVQITFHETIAPEKHAMPPGGFRVAIVNCWDRAAGNEARSLLRDHFSPRDCGGRSLRTG